MPANYELEIMNTDKVSHTGYVTVTCRVHETEEDGSKAESAVEKFGVETHDIIQNYGGDIERWLREYVAPQMIDRHKQRTDIHADIHRLKGKRVKIVP